MKSVFLLVFIGFSFDCGMALNVDKNSGYKKDYALRESVVDDGNHAIAVQLSNGKLTSECKDNGNLNSSNSPSTPTTGGYNVDNIEKLGNLSQKNIKYRSEWSSHSFNNYEVNNEEYHLPRLKKRQSPKDSQSPLHPYSSQVNSRKTFVKIKNNNNNDRTNSLPNIDQISENSELKSLLKIQQISGFSLSEILQQSNLSLSDLIKRKTEVIRALKASDIEREEKLSTNNNGLVIKLTSSRVNEHTSKNNEKITTTSADFPMNMTTLVISNENEEIMAYSDFRRENEGSRTTADHIHKFHQDSILNSQNIPTSTEFTPTIPITKETIQMSTGRKKLNFMFDTVDADYQNEEPIIYSDSNDKYDKVKIMYELSPTNHRVVKPKNNIYEEILVEIEPEARTEILDLLTSSVTAAKLEAILKSRNMSLEELIALRQRGSSRLHLAQIKTTNFDLPMNSLDKNQHVSLQHRIENPDITQNLNIRQGNESIIIDDLKTNKFMNDYRNNEKIDKHSIHLVELLSAFKSLPFTVNARPKIPNKNNNHVNTTTTTITTTTTTNNDKNSNNNNNHYHNNNNNNNNDRLIFINSIETNEKMNETDINDSSTVDHDFEGIKHVNKNVKNADEENIKNTNRQENSKSLEILMDNDLKSLSRVKPNIIASGTILGVTFFSFLVIFVGLKIRQKQKLIHSNPLSRTVFQIPINSRKLSNSSSNTIMINVMATSTSEKQEKRAIENTVNNGIHESKSDIENDSLDADDSWDTIPNFSL